MKVDVLLTLVVDLIEVEIIVSMSTWHQFDESFLTGMRETKDSDVYFRSFLQARHDINFCDMNFVLS